MSTFFRDQYPDLYNIFSKFISITPDFRDPNAVARFPASIKWGDNEAKWKAIYEELEAIAIKSGNDDDTDERILAHGQDSNNYIFFNYPSLITHFLISYPTISWILAHSHIEWCQILIATGLVINIKEANDSVLSVSLSNKDIVKLFDVVRDMETYKWCMNHFSSSTEVKRLEEVHNNAKKNLKSARRYIETGKTSTFMEAYLTQQNNPNLNLEYLDSLTKYKNLDDKHKVDTSTINYDIYNLISSTKSRITNIVLLQYISSIYWNFLAKKYINIVHNFLDIKTAAFVYWSIKNVKTHIKDVDNVRNIINILINEDEKIIEQYKELLENTHTQELLMILSIIPFITSTMYRDVTIEIIYTQCYISKLSVLPIYESHIEPYVGVPISFYASDELLVNQWNLLIRGMANPFENIKMLVLNGRSSVVIQCLSANPNIINNIKTNSNVILILKYFEPNYNIMSLFPLEEIFIKSNNINNIAYLIQLNLSMPNNYKFIDLKVITYKYNLAKNYMREDICAYLQSLL